MCSEVLKERELHFRLEIVIEPDEDEFHAFCPALKGLHTSGSTEEEAIKNAADAAIAYLTSLLKHREPIPIGCLVSVPPRKPPPRVEPLDIQVPAAAFV